MITLNNTFTWSLEFVRGVFIVLFVGGIAILCIAKNILDYREERKEKKHSKKV